MKKQLILMSIASLSFIKNINANYIDNYIEPKPPISQKEQELEKEYYAQHYAQQMEEIYGPNWRESIALAKSTEPSYHNPKRSGVVQLSPGQQAYMDKWYAYANEMKKKYGKNWFRIMDEKHIPMMPPPITPE